MPASSFHAWWEHPTNANNDTPYSELAVTLEIVTEPSVSDLYYWAMQVDFTDASGDVLSGGHCGLQWISGYPGSNAVNWGGYDSDSVELTGSTSALPSAANNANTRNYAWDAGTEYRFRVFKVANQGGEPVGASRWRCTVKNLTTNVTTTIRDLYAYGDRIHGVAVWSEVFASCYAATTTVRWSDFYAKEHIGAFEPTIESFYIWYQVDGCTDTYTRPDTTGGLLQTTNTVRENNSADSISLDYTGLGGGGGYGGASSDDAGPPADPTEYIDYINRINATYALDRILVWENMEGIDPPDFDRYMTFYNTFYNDFGLANAQVELYGPNTEVTWDGSTLGGESYLETFVNDADGFYGLSFYAEDLTDDQWSSLIEYIRTDFNTTGYDGPICVRIVSPFDVSTAEMIIMGDSLSAFGFTGGAISGTDRWCDALVDDNTISSFENSAIMGATTITMRDLIENNDPFPAQPQETDIFVAFFGANDVNTTVQAVQDLGAELVTPAIFQENLEWFLDNYPAQRQIVMYPWRWTESGVAGIPVSDATYKSYRDAAYRAALAKGATFIDVGAKAPDPSFYQHDGIHSNADGVTFLANLVKSELLAPSTGTYPSLHATLGASDIILWPSDQQDEFVLPASGGKWNFEGTMRFTSAATNLTIRTDTLAPSLNGSGLNISIFEDVLDGRLVVSQELPRLGAVKVLGNLGTLDTTTNYAYRISGTGAGYGTGLLKVTFYADRIASTSVMDTITVMR